MSYIAHPIGMYDNSTCRLELGILVQGGELLFYLKRRKQNPAKQKTVCFRFDEMGSILDAIRVAATTRPRVKNRIPVGTIICKRGNIEVEISPYWYGRSSAVILRQNHQGVAIEHEHASKVRNWIRRCLTDFQQKLLDNLPEQDAS